MQKGFLKITLAILLLLIPLTSAIQFSPSSLEFNLEKNKVACKEITFQTEQFTTAQNVWAEGFSTPWQISQFTTSSKQHGIEISHPTTINPSQNNAEVCLWGTIPGDYKGALIFQQEKVGNSIIQFAIWLKVHIEGDEQPEQTIEPTTKKSKSSSRSGSSSGSSSDIVWTSSTPNEETSETKKPEFNFPTDEISLNKPNSKENINLQSILLAITPLALLILLALTLTRRTTKP